MGRSNSSLRRIMNKAKYIFIGILIGMLIGGSIAWAASRIVMVSGASGAELGTATNPLIVQGV